MDISVGSTIKHIILQEQDNKAKLKEIREFEAKISSLNKAIRETTSQTEIFIKESEEIKIRIKKLRSRLEIEKIRKIALADQLEASKKELEDLKNKSNLGISNVWQLRSNLCENVQKIANDCDIWALLMQPISLEPMVTMKDSNKEPEDFIAVTSNGRLLKEAKERKERATKERDRLLSEPDNGPEFLRIKNALQYSLDMVSNLQKYS